VADEYAEQESRFKALLATCFHSDFFLSLFVGPEDGGNMFHLNVS
jgi:hypothetical protein